jgi:hypothetical protein
MKFRGLILATVVLLALGGTLYWSEHRKPSDDKPNTSDATPSILKLDESAITRVDLKKTGAEPIVLTKSISGAWQISEPRPYDADQNNVSSTLSSISSLTSERVVDEKASDLKQFGLAPPTFEVDVFEKDNKSQKLLLGDDTPTGSAVYTMLAGDPRVYTIASYNRNTIAKSLNELRDKRLLPVSPDQISRLEITRKNQTIEFGRNKEDWQILQPRPLRADSTKVGDLVQKLTDARMDLNKADGESKETASAFKSATPVATAKITDSSGEKELEIRKSKEDYLAKSSTVDGMYKVNADLAHALDKGVDDFRSLKVYDFSFADPNKVEIHSGSKTYVLTRSGNDWLSNGKKMDVDSVGPLLSNLRDLSADSFVDAGFAAPTTEITVTSNDGNRVEKVSIAKTEGGYIAKRENESTLYHLPAASVDTLLKAADDVKPAAAK